MRSVRKTQIVPKFVGKTVLAALFAAAVAMLCQGAFAARPAGDSDLSFKADRGGSDTDRTSSDTGKQRDTSTKSSTTTKSTPKITATTPSMTRAADKSADSTAKKLDGKVLTLSEKKLDTKLSDETVKKLDAKSTDTSIKKLDTKSSDTFTKKLDTKLDTKSSDLGTKKLDTKISDLPGKKLDTKTSDLTGKKLDTKTTDLSDKKLDTKTTDLTGKKLDAKITDLPDKKSDTKTSDLTGKKLDTKITDLPGKKLDTKTSDLNGKKLDTKTSDLIGKKLDGKITDLPGKKLDGKTTDITGKKLDGKQDITGKKLDGKTADLTGKKLDDHLTDLISKKNGSVEKWDAKEISANRFSDRYKSGQLDAITKSDTAQKLKLGDQYKMLQQGDVARRLDLEKNVNKTVNITNINVKNTTVVNQVFGPNYKYYYGKISPHYADSCLRFTYFGPVFFAGVTLYPHWSPWVDWSWHHHVHVIIDPRPLWCRPVFYDPCPPWVWWEVPVWRPLPVVACGTWVDVKPVVLVEPKQYDLQLLAVRFVDPGHPEEELGPRYRVWFRNNSLVPVTQPFNVMLLAANGDRLAAEMPQAGVRVASIEAGDVQSVDIRLPYEALSMGRGIPFSTLHVLVDSNREVPETNRESNGARLDREDILPVDPATFSAEPRVADAGGEVVLAGEGFGPQPGQVLVHLGGLEMEAEITGWYDLGIRATLPKVPLAAPTSADVIVVRGDGAAANPLKITVAP
jgi:hypothetical protein